MIGFKHPLKCVESLAPITRLCWEMGWNEINGGNISWRLSNEHIDNVLKQIVKIDEDVNTKEILEPIFLKEVPTEVYPKIEKILLDLLKHSGYPNVKFESKVDFNELYKNRGN